MNITQLVLASSIASNSDGMLHEDNLIYIGAIMGFIGGALILAIHYTAKKCKSQTPEELPVKIPVEFVI